jgi:RNA polymerase sigma factor (sigma-70 family)
MTIFLSDSDLLQRFRAGDREALARVYWEYVEIVESLLRRSLRALPDRPDAPRGGRVDVADLVQEVFVRAFAPAARLSYDDTRSYRPFIVAIARNALVDCLRRSGRELPVDEATLESLGQISRSDEHADSWADPHTMRVVDGYVATLAPLEDAVYKQRYVCCLSQIEAAEAIGISRQALRTIEARIRNGLARELRRSHLFLPDVVEARYVGPALPGQLPSEVDEP